METMKVLYIAGVERSGSTIFQNVLGQAPDLWACGELRQLWHRALLQGRSCGCETEPLAECPFWQQVFERAFGGIGNVQAERWFSYRQRTRTRHFPLLLFPKGGDLLRARLGKYPDVLARLYTAIQDVSGRDIIIDSSKSPTHAWLLDTIPQLELLVVHLLRDPRGVAYSILKRKRQGHPAYSSYSLRHSAVEWGLTNYLSEKLRSVGEMKYKRMHYESFTRTPLEVVNQVLGWVDAEEKGGSWIDGHEVTLSTTHTAGGSPHRFSTGTIRLREDSAWETGLNEEEKRQVERWTGGLMSRYGYDREH